MKFARSFRSAVAGILALIVLIALWIVIVVENCERNISADETAGMVQSIPFGGNK